MVFAALLAFGSILGIRILQPGLHKAWFWQRAAIQDRLSQTAEKHLLLVQYGAHHNADQEWVYNGADIDGSKVVWARAMNQEEDAKLLRYFADRQAWLLRVDNDNGPFNLVSLSTTATPVRDHLRDDSAQPPADTAPARQTCAR